MKTVIIASTNKVKINAAQIAFTSIFPGQEFTFIGCAAQSNVSEQPMGSDETLRGAQNRLTHARALHPHADYWMAFEGGVEETGSAESPQMTSVIWVISTDGSNRISTSRCVTFEIPPPIADLIRGGMTLGAADDLVFNRTNSNHQNGAIGIVTHDALTRTRVYADGGIMSLVPFRNPALYTTETSREAA